MATKSKKNSTTKNKKNSTKQKKQSLKNEKNKINNISSDSNSNFTRYVYIVCGVIIFICLFYFLTIYITSKNKDESNSDSTKESTEVFSYSDIMVGRSFSVSDGEYLVIYYDKSDEDINSKCSSLVSAYGSKEDKLDIYTVDMSNGLNKKYSGEEANTSPTNAGEIVINGPTLIKFNDGNVVDYVEGIDSITSYLE